MSKGYEMTDKHLLWWIFKAVDDHSIDLRSLLDEDTWKRVEAPDWVFPALQEKYEEFRKR